MRWSGIQSAIDIFKTRFNVENVINQGYKAFTSLKLSISQDNQCYRRDHGNNNNFSDNIVFNNYSSSNILSNNNLSINNLSDNILIKESENPNRKEKKNIHATVSEYWKDALYNHWFILIQGLILVTLIMIISPWIGHDFNEDNYSYDDSYFDHRPDVHLKQLRKTIEERTNSISRKPSSFFSFFSSGKDNNNYNKRSGILRRKRPYKRFY